MPITLEQAKVGMSDKVDQQVIDQFRRSSRLLDLLTFDDAVSAGTGGSTLAYGYIQLKTPTTAGRRDINSDYAPVEAVREEKVTKLDIFGQAYEIDRVIANTSGAVSEVAFQNEQAVKATANAIHNAIINADSENGSKFDGLAKLLKGTSNDVDGSSIDVSTGAKATENGNDLCDALDKLIALCDETPSCFILNTNTKLKVVSIARRLGFWTKSEDAFGRPVDKYNGIELIDAGNYYDGSATKPVVEDGAIYAVCLGINGFHGITPTGANAGTGIEVRLPNFNDAGAVKKGDVEMVMGVALKSTLKASRVTGIVVK